MNFKSLPQLLDHFKEQKTCEEYLENLRWAGSPKCPHCGSENPYRTTRGFKCSNNDCYKKFTVKVGTIFQGSRIPLRLWFAAIYLCTVHKKGISSVQLGLDLGLPQKTAWFVLHRIREMMSQKAPNNIGGEKAVEVDETYFGKEQSETDIIEGEPSKHKAKLRMVVGIIERQGKVVVEYVKRGSKKGTVGNLVKKFVKSGKVYSDESSYYNMLIDSDLDHEAIKKYDHKGRLAHFRKGDVYTNTIESFWNLLKRGIYGIYYHVSDKHLQRYLNEFAERFNARDLTIQERFDYFLKNCSVTLSYDKLTGKKNK